MSYMTYIYIYIYACMYECIHLDVYEMLARAKGLLATWLSAPEQAALTGLAQETRRQASHTGLACAREKETPDK